MTCECTKNYQIQNSNRDKRKKCICKSQLTESTLLLSELLTEIEWTANFAVTSFFIKKVMPDLFKTFCPKQRNLSKTYRTTKHHI